jgi:hypothetical protein
MENEPPQDEGKQSRRGRLMGKLFGAKERRPMMEETGTNLNDFFNGPSDTLQVSHAAPSALPMLSKLDTSSAQRYPQALAVGSRSQQSLTLRPQSRSPGHSPRRSRKGLVVRFVDTWPEIIGEGGDETDVPVIEISRRKRARGVAPPPPQQRAPPVPERPPSSSAEPPNLDDPFVGGPLKRTQTGFSPSPGPQSEEPKTVIPGRAASTRYLESSRTKDENRRSFIEVHQAEMREAEGQAFAQAARSASVSSQHNYEERRESPGSVIHESPTSINQRPRTPDSNRLQRPQVEQSPASIHSTSSIGQQSSSTFSRQASMSSQKDAMTAIPVSRQQSLNVHDVVTAAGTDAMDAFVTRTRHLFELFRLHAETVRPVSACAMEDVARALLWWFLKGRTALEIAIRERPSSPQAQMDNELDRQQAYANLAKGYWLSEEVIPEIMEDKRLAPEREIEEVRQCLIMNVRKLAISMKRNGFLPPEEAFLPQQIDKSIWVEYPKLSQDMVALLTAGGSAIAQAQRQTPAMGILESLPLGDSSENFNYGRISVEAFLMEQGVESQRLYFPCLLSMVRPQRQPNLVFILASQNGAVQLRIQGSKNFGPTWDDVRWRSETCTLDIRLPRGFVLVVQCSQQDFRMLWSMYDFGAKVQSTLYPRNDESVIYRSTLRAFQYFDSDPQSRVFPKEAVSSCDVALFERILKEGYASGPRSFHRGSRIAVVTGPRTRTLSGVNHVFQPQQPVQFGFLRGEMNDPALLLKFDNGRSKGSMVLSFNDEKERFRFHSLFIGTALNHDEKITVEVPLLEFAMTQSLANLDGIPCIKKQAYKLARIVNDEQGVEDHPSTVLSDKLRVIVDFKNGTITDRLNVSQGELKMRLEVTDAKRLLIYRLPQQDMTIAVSETQVPKELPKELSDALLTLSKTETIRIFKFQTLKDLHDFQAALTGFRVIFDGLAQAFAISRRRMVVPIHKKWEAGWTRIQVVQQDKVVQLVAFFGEFHHGRCMGFVLKGTDVFETFNRSGKAGLKIVDAKFPLPKVADDGEDASDDMAFVCLDLPDLPGEHDDISILFENESGKLTWLRASLWGLQG